MYFKQNVYFALENHENPIGMGVYTLDFPGSSTGKESICNAGDLWLIPGSGKSPGGEKWQPTPVYLPEKFHGQRSLCGPEEPCGPQSVWSQGVGHN